MGQKVNPTGFRLGISKKQNANWYAKGKDFSTNLVQDLKVYMAITQTYIMQFTGLKFIEKYL